jgi:hypothetical protein
MAPMVIHEPTDFTYSSRNNPRSIFHVTNIWVSLDERCSGPNISSYSPYEGKPLTVLHHPGHKVWLVLSLRSQGNVDHLESTLNRVSISFSISLDKGITGMA